MFQYSDYEESAAYIKVRLNGFAPSYLLILGSGLGALADQMQPLDNHEPVFIPYGEIPHFRTSTAMNHAGRFVAGSLGGKPVLAMQGRLHVYEGYTAEEVAYPVLVAKLLGVKSLIVTNAVGAINTAYNVGDLVVLTDFIKLSFPNPLIRKNIPELGNRFCDMTKVFDRPYMQALKKIARDQNITLQEGVYFYTPGPQFETPAEIHAFRTLGADVVGMSTVHECINAVHAGMRILGISLVTNMAAGILDQALSAEEVVKEGDAAKDRFANLLLSFLKAQ